MSPPSARPQQRGPDRVPRRRRDPAEAERGLLDAAEQILREGALRDLTPQAIAARAGMARSSFYVYFPDVPTVVLRLADRLQRDLGTMTDRWVLGSGEDLLADARGAIEGVVAVFAEHGAILRALADGAPGDARVEAVFRPIVDGFIDVTEGMIRREQAAGRIRPLPARETAAALILMNERFLTHTFGRADHGQATGPVVEALLGIWVLALYQVDPLANG